MTDPNQQRRQVGGGRGAVGDIAPKLAEPTEASTHLAFYVGWPKAMTAVTVARQVSRG